MSAQNGAATGLATASSTGGGQRYVALPPPPPPTSSPANGRAAARPAPPATVMASWRQPGRPPAALVGPARMLPRFLHGGDVDRALAMGRGLVDRLVATYSLGLDAAFADLGEIDLPPVTGSVADQASLRSAAPLYLASELEAAGLLPAAETLAGMAASGGLTIDLEPVAGRLRHFWRTRHERFAPEERRAFFTRLFGTDFGGPGLSLPRGAAQNVELESLFVDLCEALYRHDALVLPGQLRPSEVPVRLAAQQVAANLSPRSGGLATYVADDVIRATQAALDILKHPAVQRAFGTRTVWGVVRALRAGWSGFGGYGGVGYGVGADVNAHVTRGKNGMIILNWVADSLPALDGVSARLLGNDDPAIPAATAWLQASLSLEEAREAQAPPRTSADRR